MAMSALSGLIELIRQTFPGRPTYTEAQVPDLTDKFNKADGYKVMIVTGANTGIGKEITQILYSKNAKVYLMARSAEKTKEAIASIKAAAPDSKGDLTFIRLDLADLPSIETSANDFLRRENKLHVLFNNAGVAYPDKGSVTKQGYELQLGVNCLGTFTLTQFLTPALVSTAAKSARPNTVRTVWTSSSAVYGANVPDFQKNVTTIKEKVGRDQYFISKLGNYFHSTEFAARHKKDGVVSVAINPGNLDSDLWRTQGAFFQWFLRTTVLHPPKYGAYTSVFAGLSPDVTLEKSGSFIAPWGKFGKPTSEMVQATKTTEEGGSGIARGFWEWTEAEVRRST